MANLMSPDELRQVVSAAIEQGETEHERLRHYFDDDPALAQTILGEIPKRVRWAVSGRSREVQIMLLTRGVNILGGKIVEGVVVSPLLVSPASIVYEICQKAGLNPVVILDDIGDGPDYVLVIKIKKGKWR